MPEHINIKNRQPVYFNREKGNFVNLSRTKYEPMSAFIGRKQNKTQNIDAETIFRDSPQRSFIKALTYRLLASGVMFVVFFIIFRSTTQRTLNESLGDASLISIIDFTVKLAIYYFHERIWSGINWGKYWRRNYWARRAWKRAYRKAHK